MSLVFWQWMEKELQRVPVAQRTIGILHSLKAQVRMPANVRRALLAIDPNDLPTGHNLRHWLSILLRDTTLRSTFIGNRAVIDVVVDLLTGHDDARALLAAQAVRASHTEHWVLSHYRVVGALVDPRVFRRDAWAHITHTPTPDVLFRLCHRLRDQVARGDGLAAWDFAGGGGVQSLIALSVIVLDETRTRYLQHRGVDDLLLLLRAHMITGHAPPVPWQEIRRVAEAAEFPVPLAEACLAYGLVSVPDADSIHHWAVIMLETPWLARIELLEPPDSPAYVDGLLSPAVYDHIRPNASSLSIIGAFADPYSPVKAVHNLAQHSVEKACAVIAHLPMGHVEQLVDVLQESLRSNPEDAIYAIASRPATVLAELFLDLTAEQVLQERYGHPATVVGLVCTLDADMGVRLLASMASINRRATAECVAVVIKEDPSVAVRLDDSVWSELLREFCRGWYSRGACCGVRDESSHVTEDYGDGTYEVRGVGKRHLFEIRPPSYLRIGLNKTRSSLLRAWTTAMIAGTIPAGSIEAIVYLITFRWCFPAFEALVQKACQSMVVHHPEAVQPLLTACRGKSDNPHLLSTMASLMPAKGPRMCAIDQRLFCHAINASCGIAAKALLARQRCSSEWMVRVLVDGPPLMTAALRPSLVPPRQLLRDIAAFLSTNGFLPERCEPLLQAILYATRIVGVRSTGNEIRLSTSEAPFFEELFRKIVRGKYSSLTMMGILTLYVHNPALVTVPVAHLMVELLDTPRHEILVAKVMEVIMSRPAEPRYNHLWRLSQAQPKRTRGYEQDPIRQLPPELLREVLELNGVVIAE